MIALQPEGISNPKEYLKKLGLLDKVDDLLCRGNTPTVTAEALNISAKKVLYTWYR